MAMMGDRGAGFGRGRGMPGRGGPPRGRGGFDRGGARGGRGMPRGAPRGAPAARGTGRGESFAEPATQGEAIPTTGYRGGATRGIPTRGTYTPRGGPGMGPRGGRGGPGRGIAGGRGGFDRGAPRGRGGDRGRGDGSSGFMPRGRGSFDRGNGMPQRGSRGGGEYRGRGGDFVPRGRGASSAPSSGGFESRQFTPRGGQGFVPRGRGGFERRTEGEAPRGRADYVPRGRGSTAVSASPGYAQRSSAVVVDRQPYRTPVPQSTDYRGGYGSSAVESLKRTPMGAQAGAPIPKRSRYDDEPVADPYQSSYYRTSQSSYDSYAPPQTSSYSNGTSMDYHQHHSSGGYAPTMSSELPPSQEAGGYMAAQSSAQSYAADPYSSYSQMPSQRMAPAEQSWGTASDPYGSSAGYGSSASYAQSSSTYNGRGYNTSAPAYDTHSYGGTYSKPDYGTSTGSYSQSRDYEMDRRY